MEKDSSETFGSKTKQTSSSVRSAIKAKESYHVAFSHLLALLIMTTIQQLFTYLSLLFLEDHFSDFYDHQNEAKISILHVLMIIDFLAIVSCLFFRIFLRRMNGVRVWLAVVILCLTALSLFFNIYEIITILVYTVKFDKIPIVLGFFLRVTLLVVESVFLIYKTKLAREYEESSVALLANVNTSEEIPNARESVNNAFGDSQALTYFVLLMDFLKMEVLNCIIIGILFLFFVFGDGSSEMVMGEVFAWFDFVFIVFGFFLYIYSQLNQKILKMAMVILFFSNGTIIMSYMLTYLNSSYYDSYDYKMLYGYGMIGFSSTLRGLILIMSLMHYFKKKD